MHAVWLLSKQKDVFLFAVTGFKVLIRSDCGTINMLQLFVTEIHGEGYVFLYK